MKRYRVLAEDFDTRATILGIRIEDSWEPTVKETWRQTHQQIIRELVVDFGPGQLDAKLKNFVDLGPAPFSIVAFHNRFQRQARNAFVIGSYYPALTGACALGERILNHLILKLRDDYRSTPEYKRAYRKQSFDDWNEAIDVLIAWSVLLPQVAVAFRKLAALRHRSLHFSPETDTNDRELALSALALLGEIIGNQFGSRGMQPWFINSSEGFLKRAVETQPFIREIYLPASIRVGPEHRLRWAGDRWNVLDERPYASCEISDEEFVDLYKASIAASSPNPG